MWIVTLTNNSEFFKKELLRRISKLKIYFPKIKSRKNKTKNILGNYLFCYSEKFNSDKNYINTLKNLKGLKQILFADSISQKEILNFINYCKSHEDNYGFIKNSFFKDNIISKGKIENGPFSNYIFEILSKDKKRIEATIGDLKFTISDKSKYSYSSI